MSGRKDYEYELEQRRLEQLAAAIQARRDERARQTRLRLARAEDAARLRAARIAQSQQQSNRQQRQAAAERTRREIQERTQRQSRQQAADTEGEPAAAGLQPAELQLQQAEPQQHVRGDSAAERALQQQLDQQLQAVLQWRESFAENDIVQNFASAEHLAWRQSVDNMTAEFAGAPPSSESLLRLQQANAAAEQLEVNAGELADKFYARNLVLADIIDSLKEIGFFVSDPEFADARQPSGLVILRANRGNQLLTTSLSLNRQVESDWQGVHGEYCTNGFFEFVRAMDKRGVKVTTTDPQLQPKLLQKGAKELPGGESRATGADG